MVDTVTFVFKDLNVVDFTETYETSRVNELYVQKRRGEKGEKGEKKKTFPFAFEKDVLIKCQVISYFD